MAPAAFMAMLFVTMMMFIVAMAALLVVVALNRIVMLLNHRVTLDHPVIPVWLATIIPGVDRSTDGRPETGPKHGTVAPAHFGAQGTTNRATQGATDSGIGGQVSGHRRGWQQ
jgi:hypothetical protein